MWDSMFTPEISVVEKMLRPIIVYLFLLVGLRLSGKRELAQLNPMDLIVLLTLSNTVQNAIIGPDNSLSGGLIGATTLLALNYLVVRFLFRHEAIDRLIEGEAVVLIEDGQIREHCLQAELITHEELEVAAHKQGFASLDEVSRAVLESGGSLSFVGREPPMDEVRHSQLTSQLSAIERQLTQVQAALAARG